jgi:putative ABC transport system permease protein
MSPADLVRFSAGALRGHRLRTGLSLLGVCIGVGSVILLTSLGEGARLYVTGEFQTLGTNLLVVFPGKTETTGMAPIMGGVPHDLTLDDAEALARQIPSIRQVAPLTIGTARARYGDRSREITVAGTTAEFEGVRKLVIQSGRYLPEGEIGRGQRVCVIGNGVRRELFPDESPLGKKIRIGGYRYQVIGVMAPRGESLGMDLDEIIHIPVSQSMRMFNRTSLFRILIEVASHGQMETAKASALELLTERHDGEEDVTIITQDSLVSTFGRIFDILTAALGGIAAISLSVAGIGIMNVMLVSVSERTAEIGLLKALGVTRAQVLGAFLVEAALISTAGGLLGLGAGLGAARLLQAFYPDFPAQPPSWAVVGALVVAVSVGILFGALPARRAARLDPVASLQGG